MNRPLRGLRDDKHTHARSDCHKRHKLRDAELERDPFVHPNELDDESQRASADEISEVAYAD
jgi:hypothetical protein